jgi:ketosteroid isomerase-like protein
MSAVPATVNQYFALDARRDHGAILALFADDAVVVDEGRTMRGRDAIRSWREGAVSRYSYTTEIVGAEQLAPDRVLVRGRITGDFPGGTADLGWDFTLDEERITQLVIAP